MLPLTLALLPQGGEWLVIVLVVVLLFGAAKIPQLARSLGRAKAEFKKGAAEGASETRESEDDKTLKVARDLGIPTEGRALADIKADIRQKMSQ